MVAMDDVTDDGSIIFGKNSDRQTNEPLSIRYIPSAIYPSNSKIRTTYIEIDQVEKTHSCILFSPTNIYGAEMGFNSHGLVIGNEALFTKIPCYSEGLTGMDLVRLVLERCSSSREGKETIIDLLNKYGQGGNCGFTSPFYYHSSFLIVDSNECWIIETVGKEYAAKRITKGIHTISNRISFGKVNTFDEYSKNLIEQAISNGWCHSIEDFHFEKCYSDISFYPKEFYNGYIKTYFASSKIRQSRSFDLISKQSKKYPGKSCQFNVMDMFNVLRDHQQSKDFPENGLTNVDICMHGAFGPIRFNQTTGSLVSVIPKSKNQLPIHYATCTSLPCLSIFKPIWLDSSSIPPTFISSRDNFLSNASITYSSNNIWWKSEIVNRNIMKYYKKLIQQIQIERNLLENQFIYKSNKLSSKYISEEQRNHFTIFAFDQVDQLINKWFSRAYSLSFEMKSELSFFQELTWEGWRKSAKIPKQLLNYAKVEIYQKMMKFICLFSILIIIHRVYFINHHQLNIFNTFTYYLVLFISLIIYLLLTKIFPKQRKTKEEEQIEILLSRLDFNDHS
ncbi:unnamed protein product [Rotaria sordida]|uniref:Dipeptidase n=3 Tax=Rotaria sordida TaxID=392033 RepID=A0A819V3L0_9BILA|nr:unnamed protein product [Rotaria sordida]